MAVAAVDAIAGDVPLVAELDRLFACDTSPGDPGGATDELDEAEKNRGEEDDGNDAGAGERVRAAAKDLCHRSMAALAVETVYGFETFRWWNASDDDGARQRSEKPGPRNSRHHLGNETASEDDRMGPMQNYVGAYNVRKANATVICTSDPAG